MNINPKPPTALYITHVDKEGPFLKVWGQTDKRIAINIEQALFTTSQHFDEGYCILSKDNLQNGVMCCAKYSDNKYYRARITNNELIHDNCVEVIFLDFGNKEIVPCSNLRSLEKFTSSFISLRPLASCFILADVVCVGGEWNDAVFEVISGEIKYAEVTCVLLMNAVKHYLVQLVINGQDLASSLISRGLMARTHVQTQEAVLLAMLPRQQPVVQQPVQQTILTYKVCSLDPGSQHPVYVSYICDGPCHFSIQLRQTEDLLVKLMSDINSMPLRPLEDCPIPGTVCLARCSEDGHMCRAVVTNEVDSQFKVFYVDFGNSEIVPLESLYQIPFKYVIPKVMAIRFALAGVEKSTVTIEMKCAFKEFVDNRLLMMRVIPVGTRTALPRCDLWDPQTNISALDVLHQAAVNAYPEPLTLNRGFSQSVKVSYVYSCKRFYVQLKSKEEELFNLMLNLQASCASNEPVQSDVVKEGLPCCALFEADSQWYRSQVLEVYTNGSVKLRYIDYGNEETVPISQLKLVEGDKLTVLRPQAIECCLNGYQNMEDDIERDNLLEELILEKEFVMKVVEMQNGRALVELIDNSNYNVASLLLDKIASSRSQVSPMLVQAGSRIEHRKSVTSPPHGFNKDRRSPRDSNNRYQDNKSNENSGSWRQENKENRGFRNQNRDEQSNEGSWRENKSFNRNNDRGFRENRNDNRNRDWKSKESGEENWNNDSKFSNRKVQESKGDDWGGSKNNTANNGNWGDSGGNSGWGDSSKGKVDHDNREDWNNKQREYTPRKNRGDFNQEKRFNSKENNWSPESPKSGGQGFKKNFRRENSEVSSSGSEHSFRKGPKSNFKSDDKFKGRKFEKPSKHFSASDNAPSESSWNSNKKTETFDYAPNTATFKTMLIKTGETFKSVISWFHNPEYFYMQLSQSQEQFRKMMEEIQGAYKGRKPNHSAVVNAPVISIFPEDNVLYRGRILETMGSSYKVYYVDFGNVAVVDKIWGLEKKFMTLPAQAVCCGLNNIFPLEDQWGDANLYSKYFDKDVFDCTVISEDNGRYIIDMTHGEDNLTQLLIDGGLVRGHQTFARTIELPILLGQQFRAMVTSVNGLNDFIVSLEYGEPLMCTMHNLDKAEETFENILKELLNQLVIVYVDNVVDDRLEVTLYDQSFGNKLEIITPDEGAFDNVEVLCPTLLLSSTIWGWVSHVQDSTMYVQPSEFVDTLTSLSNTLHEHYEAVVPENPIIPEEGFLFAVKSEDGFWYRARIVSFDDEKAEVMYLDYGNNEKVPFVNLRELTAGFMQTNILSIPVISPNPADSYFEKDVIVKVQFSEQGLEATEITERLQDECEAAPTEVAPQQENINIQETNTQEEQPNENQNLQPLSENQTLVVISHIDSPNAFYMQRAEAVNSIQELQDQLQIDIEQMPDLESPVAGVLCAAPYSVDQLWYRAQVLDSDADITTVRFVDYGNTDVLNNKTTRVKQLPQHLLTLAVNATLCSLRVKPLEEEWSPAAINRMEELIDCDNVCTEFIDQDGKINYVELFSNGQNIKDVLLSENLAAAVDSQEIGTENNRAFISHSNSPSEFWIQLESCTEELEWISEQLSGAENFPELEDLSPGALCAAMYLDEQWYRARILSNTVAGIEVLFIDFGNSCISSHLRQLPEDLIMKPPQAQKSSLKKPEGIVQWSQQATEKFSEIASDGATIFNVQKLSSGETSIVRLLVEGEDVVTKLLPVTEDCHINEVESLDKFSVIKNGEQCDNKFKLDVLSGVTWNEESLEIFKNIVDSGNTLIQVEHINEDTVRLYKDGKDIRVELGGVKSSPIHNLSKTDLEENSVLLREDNDDDVLQSEELIKTDNDITAESNSHDSTNENHDNKVTSETTLVNQDDTETVDNSQNQNDDPDVTAANDDTALELNSVQDLTTENEDSPNSLTTENKNTEATSETTEQPLNSEAPSEVCSDEIPSSETNLETTENDLKLESENSPDFRNAVPAEASGASPQKSSSSVDSCMNTPEKTNSSHQSVEMASTCDEKECDESNGATEIKNGDCDSSLATVESPKKNVLDAETVQEVGELLKDIVENSLQQNDISNRHIKAKISFDDRIVPAAVSRPQSPSKDEEENTEVDK